MVTIFNLPPIIFALVVGALMLSCILLGYYIGRCIAYTEIEEDCDDYEREIEYWKTKSNYMKPFIEIGGDDYEKKN